MVERHEINLLNEQVRFLDGGDDDNGSSSNRTISSPMLARGLYYLLEQPQDAQKRDVILFRTLLWTKNSMDMPKMLSNST